MEKKQEMELEQESKKNEIVKNVVDFAVTWLAIWGGYLVGASVTKWKLSAGLLAMMKEMPELEPMMNEALKRLKESVKK